MINRSVAGFTLAAMTEMYLEQVLAIETHSFSRPWSRQHFLDELASPHAASLVALSNNEVVAGFICYRIILDEAEILDVAVAQTWRRNGLGAVLVREALALCQQRGVVSVGLEVRVSNLAAIRLYQQQGFAEHGRRRNYYENGEDALLMQIALSPNEDI
jgi:[ribosomal protein S18]-alanine N-acetyltransferase